MKHLSLLTNDGTEIATLYIDPTGNLQVAYLDETYRAELDPIITDEAEAGITFTTDQVTEQSPNHHATVMKPHSPTDPLFLDGLAQGFKVSGPIIINGHEIIARVVEQ